MIPDQLPVSEYLGKENRTTSGLSCTPWASDDRQLQPYDLQYSTYVHNNFLDDTMFPDGSIAAAENFCRDPSNDRYLWCYTKEDAIKWEECSVQCNDNSLFNSITLSYNNTSVLDYIRFFLFF